MFSLVKFDNEEYEVITSKRVKVIQDTDCIVKYTNGAKYHASLQETADTKEQLIELLGKIQRNDGNNQEQTTPENIEWDNGNPQELTPSENVQNNNHINRGLKLPKNIQQDNDKGRKSTSQLQSIVNVDFINSTFITDKQPMGNNTSTPENALQSKSNGFFKELELLEILDNSSVHGSISSDAPTGITEIDTVIGQSWLGVSGASSQDENMLVTTSKHAKEQRTCESASSKDNDSTNDDVNKDSDYHPAQSTTNTNDTAQTSTNISQAEKSSLLDEAPAVDIRKLEIPSSGKYQNKHTKKHFCSYCHTLQTKFARHLTLKHKNEADVKKFIYLPPQCLERKKIIEAIRRKGDYLHNTKPELNTGILILCRQRQATFTKCAEDYICCKKCKGFFSKATIRIHYPKCDDKHQKGVREITAAGRRLTGYIHNQANEVLRRIIFPVLRDDDVTRCIKYDRLIILFGNKLSDKYTLDHQHDMIRAYLRLLGRFKLAITKFDKEVSDFASIFKPQRFDSAVLALRHVAHWDPRAMWFKTPAVANNMTTLIKKIGQKLKSECIKVQNYSQKTDAEDFLLLWTEEVPVLINKKAQEDQVLQKRQKKVILPSKQDIKLLYDYLKKEATIASELLQETFRLDAFKLLNECTLVLIQIFNRRRAGEIERLKLADYENKQKLDDNLNEDMCENLSEETRKYAQQYVRLTLRGKLDRTVSVLLSPFVTRYIDTLLRYRKNAGIKANNDYVFAAPNTNPLKKKYIRACPLMKRFSNECGADIPSALRGTTLRKHIATFTAMLDVEDTQVERLANFMGHHKDIHKNIYRMPVPVAEMTDVSRLLVAAMDGDERAEDESEAENSDSSVDEYADDPNNNKSNEVRPHSRIAPSPVTEDASDESSNINDTKSDSGPSLPTKRKSRSTSPFGKTKRVRWSGEERRVVTKHFGRLEKLKHLPSLQECHNAIKKYKALRRRVPQQLKTWIDNQRRAETRRMTYVNAKS